MPLYTDLQQHSRAVIFVFKHPEKLLESCLSWWRTSICASCKDGLLWEGIELCDWGFGGPICQYLHRIRWWGLHKSPEVLGNIYYNSFWCWHFLNPGVHFCHVCNWVRKNTSHWQLTWFILPGKTLCARQNSLCQAEALGWYLEYRQQGFKQAIFKLPDKLKLSCGRSGVSSWRSPGAQHKLPSSQTCKCQFSCCRMFCCSL